MGESVAAAFFEPIIKRITIAVRRNVFPSLGITVGLTVVLVFMLLNPWFGSQRAKFFVVAYMMGGADDIEYVLRQTSTDSNFGPSLIAGAARAGFYRASDRSIVDQWSEDFAGKNVVNQRKLDVRYAAILAAREKAETHQPRSSRSGWKASPAVRRAIRRGRRRGRSTSAPEAFWQPIWNRETP